MKPEVQAKRSQFLSLQRTLCAHRLVFVDEFGCNRGMARRFARAFLGERAVAHAPINYGDNISVIAAMRHDGVTAAMSVPGAVDGDAFMAFVTKVLVPTLRPEDTVVLDNLGAHKMACVREAIEAAGASLLLLPPYSPDLNPIEQCISKIKHFLRSVAARTKEGLDQALIQALEMITHQDASNWVLHCGYEPLLT